MRGESSKQSSMLFLRSPETLVPKEHPIRAVKALADAALREMSAKLDGMYASSGRASIPPEWLLKGSLLMALYSVRSERMFCEQLGYNMMANVVEPDDLAVRGVQKRATAPAEVQLRSSKTSPVALGLRENVLRTDGELLRFHHGGHPV